jgi:hypothetical protein
LSQGKSPPVTARPRHGPVLAAAGTGFPERRCPPRPWRAMKRSGRGFRMTCPGRTPGPRRGLPARRRSRQDREPPSLASAAAGKAAAPVAQRLTSPGATEFPGLAPRERKLRRAMQEPGSLDTLKRGTYCLDCKL